MSDLKGRTFLVTGANTGIGRVTAEVLAQRGGKVFLACRSEEKTKPVLDAIVRAGGKAEFHALDLGDLAAVRASAKAFLDRKEPLHVLVNNAGLAGKRGLTKDGFELAFGTNHLGPFLFTELLLPLLRESKPARIVNVSSNSHYTAKALDFSVLRERTKSVTGLPEYEVSKLCNVLFTKELARGKAGDGVRSYALHPGMIATDIWRQVPFLVRPLIKLFMLTVEEGADTQIWLASTDDLTEADDGLYFVKRKVRRPNRLADDEALAKELWEKSEAWTRG